MCAVDELPETTLSSDTTAGGAVPFDGATRFYQVLHRNTAAYSTGATFNFTNGIRIDWAR